MYETMLTEVDEFKDAWLVKLNEKFYVVSAIKFDTLAANMIGRDGETLVFESDETGNVTNWIEVAGLSCYDHSAAVLNLIDRIGD